MRWSGTRGLAGLGAERQDDRLPLMLLGLLPSLRSQWSDKEELVEPVGEEEGERKRAFSSIGGPLRALQGQAPTPEPWNC